LLGTVSLLALVSLLGAVDPTPALAFKPEAYVTVDNAGALVAEGWISMIAGVTNTAGATATNSTSIAADLDNITGGVTYTGTIPPGNLTIGTVTVTANILGAYATGNLVTSTADLGLIANAGGGVNGIAILTSSANVPGVSGNVTYPTVIASEVGGSSLFNTLTNVASGSAFTLTNNLITAQVTGNSAASTVSGQVPSGYVGAAGGGNVTLNPLGSGNLTLSVTGDVAIGTNQVNDSLSEAFGSGALLGNDGANSIALVVNSSAGNTTQTLVGVSADQSGNTLSAIFTGNSATNGVSAETGGATTLQGSIAIGNQQLNTTSLGGGNATIATAGNLDSLVTTQVLSGEGNEAITLQGGTVTQANNTISSSATGNSAVGAGQGAYGNSIQLAGGLSLSGSVFEPNNEVFVAGFGNVATNVVADLALANLQNNAGAPLDSLTAGGAITTLVQNSVGSTIAMSGAAITATTTGNNVSNAILAPSGNQTGTASIVGSVALGNSQTNFGSPAMATLDTNTVSATIGTDGSGAPSDAATVTGASVSIAGSSLKAAAYGSQAANTINLAATTVAVPDFEGFLGSEGPFGGAFAGVSLNNAQFSEGSLASALNGGSTITLTANSATPEVGSLNDTFSISGVTGAPTIDAVAVANAASNSVAISATTMSGSAALLNTQVDLSGAVAELADPSVAMSVNTAGEPAAVTGSSLTVGTSLDGKAGVGNTLRAIAYGDQAANALSVSATTLINPAGGDPDASRVNDGTAQVQAGFGLLNQQWESSNIGSVDAVANLTNTPITITIGAGVSGSTVANAGNGLVTAAYGNQADNIASVAATTLPQLTETVGNLTTNVYLPVADVTNVQEVFGDVTATVNGPASGSVFTTSVGAGATNSTLGVSSNTVLTLAEANQAVNVLTVGGGSIADASPTPLTGLSSTEVSGVNTMDAAFTVHNVQLTDARGSPSVDAIQTGTGALLALGGTANGSSLQANGNQFLTTTYANTAYNGLAMGTANAPITTLAASGGVQNVQQTDGLITAMLGASSAAPIPAYVGAGWTADQSGNVSGSGNWNGSDMTLTAAGTTVLVFNTLADANAFMADISSKTATVTQVGVDVTIDGGAGENVVFSRAPGTGVQDWSWGNTSGGTQPQGVLDVVGVPAGPAVQITVAGSIVNSTLGVNNNVASSLAVANNAANLVSVNATTLSASAGLPSGNVTSGGHVITPGGNVTTTPTVTALADYAVSNNQAATGDVTASTYGSDSITASAIGPNISGSALSVSNNSQAATAEANLAGTTLDVTATNSGATGALVSYQTSTGNVTANSGDASLVTPPDSGEASLKVLTVGQTVMAPGAITDSSLTMSGNTNSALAVMNDATNTVTASGANLLTANTSQTNATAAITQATSSAPGSAVANADYSLTNQQTAGTGLAVTATATTQVLNSDSATQTTTGLIDSSAALDDNTTSAKAYSNRADNTLTLSGANVTATGAVANSQSNAAAVNADVASTVLFSLNGTPGDGSSAPAASGSSISVSGNSAQAQGVGNQATNALNATPSANYGAQGGSQSSSAAGASASYAVLNDQSNSGAVSAAGTGSYMVALNATPAGSSPVSGSTITVQNNSLNVGAYGNSAANSVTLTALNSGGATAALDSVQTNTGSINATATNVSFGVTIGSPGAVGSSISVANNSITAHAVGNAVSNAVVAH
jgi:hypothetical protein